MQNLFCPRCKSLLPPGSSRCRSCGAPADDASVSRQTCLFDGMERKDERPAPKTTRVDGAPFMPYEPRGCQMMIIEDIRNALADGRHVVMESGTGTGKTIVALASSLEHAKSCGKKVVYLTRTISQSDQVMRELRAIGTIKDVSGIAVTGRNKSCPLYRGTPGFENLSPNVLSMMCDERKQRSQKGQSGGCRYYDRVKAELDSIEAYCKREYPTSETLDKYCESLRACPYEAKKALMRKMDVVAVPYVHLLSKDIRNNLLANLNTAGDATGIVPVIDEAHNFIDAARDEESFVIDARMVDSAIDECSTIGRNSVLPGVSAADFLKYFKNCMRAVATEKMGLNVREYVFDGDYIEERMMSKFDIGRGDLSLAIDEVIDIGEERSQRLIEAGETRVSAIETLGLAMRNWCTASSKRFVRTMKIDQDGEYLSASCIDPSEISFFLRGIPGAIHMSGTLQPLNQYARVLGLPDTTRCRTYPSPFPPENRKVIYVEDVTTRQSDMKSDPGMQNRIERYIVRLCESVDKNTLVFFTSYNNMRAMRPYIETHLDKEMYWEEARNLRKTMGSLELFRTGRNGVFFSVMGGSVAEGIDFPGDELCFAIIVGIPYPPPSPEMQAMSAMYDERYGAGKGWVYCSEVPALRKIKQAVGRLIRTETDRGMAVILDSRTSRYAKQLDAVPSKDPTGDVTRFFIRR